MAVAPDTERAAGGVRAAWPQAGLRLRTERVELRLPQETELAALALAAGHEPYRFDVPMFSRPDDTPAERTRRFLRYHWDTLAGWDRRSWTLSLFAFVDGRPVGQQVVSGDDFADLREVSTGSWVHPHHRGAGVGVHMRAAVLDLAFTHLGARYALSGAREDNGPSLAVSRRFGYREDGCVHQVAAGQVHRLLRLRLSAQRWRRLRPDIPVEVTGLAPCLPLFGIG
ncbi:hypothetical protein BJF78_14560 [Pseudonocardia sp. CNS-139]|nr:hypothetical protein BJF78_14560 [Pseudonocardia sp. CNS-139]